MLDSARVRELRLPSAELSLGTPTGRESASKQSKTVPQPVFCCQIRKCTPVPGMFLECPGMRDSAAGF